MQSLEHILQLVFGLRQFRPHQREIIEDILKGHDVVCVMPTGAGKSLCFQLPAVMVPGLTIIVSPLISLMADQVHHLKKLNIPALFLNSSQSMDEQRKVLAQLWEGFGGLLYIAPERFSAPSFQRVVPRLRPKFFVVDEAHCVSFWGHDFRPEYMRLSEVRKQLGSPVTVAVTATATPQVREDMVRMLDLRDPRMHVTGFDRPNLTYACRHFERPGDKDAALLRFLQRHTGSGIVYCSTRKNVELLAALFEDKFPDRTVCAYHAGMSQEARRRSQAGFMKAGESIVVATNAFGMGINKADIRYVVHYNLPGSVEAYYQEAGRAGRDGKASNCILFFNGWDLKTQRFFIDNIGENNPALSKEEVLALQRNASRKLDLMLTYAETQRCRRRQILDYFGESTAISGCGCDVCQGASVHRFSPDAGTKTQIFPASRREAPRDEAASRYSSTAQRGSRRNVAAEVEPLDGAAEARFERLKNVRRQIADEHKWPAFCIMHDRVLREVAREEPGSIKDLAAIKGVGATKAAKFGPSFLEAMGAGDVFETAPPRTKTVARSAARVQSRTPDRVKTPSAVAGLSMVNTRAAVQARFSSSKVSPANGNGARQSTTTAGAAGASGTQAETMPLDPPAQERLQRLLRAREFIAEAQNYPLFCILLDSTLREVALREPDSMQALAAIKGVGLRKAERFGATFLAALKQNASR